MTLAVLFTTHSLMTIKIHQVLATHQAWLSRNHCCPLLDCYNVNVLQPKELLRNLYVTRVFRLYWQCHSLLTLTLVVENLHPTVYVTPELA